MTDDSTDKNRFTSLPFRGPQRPLVKCGQEANNNLLVVQHRRRRQVTLLDHLPSICLDQRINNERQFGADYPKIAQMID